MVVCAVAFAVAGFANTSKSVNAIGDVTDVSGLIDSSVQTAPTETTPVQNTVQNDYDDVDISSYGDFSMVDTHSFFVNLQPNVTLEQASEALKSGGFDADLVDTAIASATINPDGPSFITLTSDTELNIKQAEHFRQSITTDYADVFSSGSFDMYATAFGQAGTYTETPNDTYTCNSDATNSYGQCEYSATTVTGKSKGGSSFNKIWPTLNSVPYSQATAAPIAVIDTGYTQVDNSASNVIPKGNCSIGTITYISEATVKSFCGRSSSDTVSWSDIAAVGSLHGTNVATLAGASSNNSDGTTGYAYDQPVYMYRITNSEGTMTANAIRAAMYMAYYDGAKVINLSLGFTDANYIAVQNPPDLSPQINDLVSKDVTIVAAAGNGRTRAGGCQIVYPAAYPNVISVAATDSNGNVASFSDCNSQVNVAASGSQNRVAANTLTSTMGWTTGDGTSYASPIVAAAAGILLRFAPTLTPAQIMNILMSTAHDVTSRTSAAFTGDACATTTGIKAGTDQCTGAGIIDIFDAVSSIALLEPEISPNGGVIPANSGATISSVNSQGSTTYYYLISSTGTAATTTCSQAAAAGSGWQSFTNSSVTIPATDLDGKYLISFKCSNTGVQTSIVVSNRFIVAPLLQTYRCAKYQGGYFYTTDYAEYQTCPRFAMRQEGAVYDATSSTTPGAVPLYRAAKLNGSGYFYTINYTEYLSVVNYNMRPEGLAMYVFPTGSAIPGTTTVYRGAQLVNQGYIYTSNIDEYLYALPANNYRQEGAVFSVFE